MRNVHLFQLGAGQFKRQVAVDGTTGAIHLLDEKAYALAQDWLQGKPLPDSPAGRELQTLVAEGVLGAPVDPVDTRLQQLLTTQAQGGIKALCLNVAHDCNLACRYCFANRGHLTPGKRLMDERTAQEAVEFLLAHSKDRNPVEVDFFGGEPLLNWDVVAKTILFGERAAAKAGKELLFTLTTNGWALDAERIAFLKDHRVALVLSLDGRREVNDRMRRRGQESVYDRVVPRFRQLAAAVGEENYYLRGTYTAQNLDFLEDVKHLLELGFRNLSLEPVVLPEDHPVALTEEHLPQVRDEYQRLAEHYLEHALKGEPYRFFHFELDLEGGSCVSKRVSGCAAGTEYFAVAPAGELYPCHQLVGQREFLLGSVTQGITRPDIGGSMAACNILTKEECKQCWARFYCGGGCHASAWNYSRNLERPHGLSCKLQQLRLEYAIYVQAILAEAGIVGHGDRFR